MKLRLTLIRHAKSSWDDSTVPDHARPLNARGRSNAPAIGAWLAQNHPAPDLLLCSDAARTRETAALILPHLTPTPPVQITPDLYLASPDAMLDLLARQGAPHIALIGHNPGIGLLAAGLVRRAPDHPRFADYPTCATCIITFDAARWDQLMPQSGTSLAFVTPADLPIFRA